MHIHLMHQHLSHSGLHVLWLVISIAQKKSLADQIRENRAPTWTAMEHHLQRNRETCNMNVVTTIHNTTPQVKPIMRTSTTKLIGDWHVYIEDPLLAYSLRSTGWTPVVDTQTRPPSSNLAIHHLTYAISYLVQLCCHESCRHISMHVLLQQHIRNIRPARSWSQWMKPHRDHAILRYPYVLGYTYTAYSTNWLVLLSIHFRSW